MTKRGCSCYWRRQRRRIPTSTTSLELPKRHRLPLRVRLGVRCKLVAQAVRLAHNLAAAVLPSAGAAS